MGVHARLTAALGCLLVLPLAACTQDGEARARQTVAPTASVPAGAVGSPRPVFPDSGCGYVQDSVISDSHHVAPGESFAYPEFPVAGGPHDAQVLSAGVYDRLVEAPAGASAPSILRAMHSLEHGYVVMLHDGLPAEQLAALTKRYGFERKVVIAGYPGLKARLVVLAWARTRYCADANLTDLEEFVSAYREGPTAPEAGAP